jgi:hypothetical protein
MNAKLLFAATVAAALFSAYAMADENRPAVGTRSLAYEARPATSDMLRERNGDGNGWSSAASIVNSPRTTPSANG